MSSSSRESFWRTAELRSDRTIGRGSLTPQIGQVHRVFVLRFPVKPTVRSVLASGKDGKIAMASRARRLAPSMPPLVLRSGSPAGLFH